MPMNVSNNLSGALFAAALSSLGAANKQPQLAMDLIEKSLSGLQTAGAAQSPTTQIARIAPVAGATGQLIDIQA